MAVVQAVMIATTLLLLLWALRVLDDLEYEELAAAGENV
jgi:hypothetical protein